MKSISIIIFILCVILNTAIGQKRVRIGIAGLSHSHVVPLLRNLERDDIQIVGIAENDKDLSKRYAERFSINEDIIFDSLDEMLEQTKPDGVITFTSIYEH